MLGCNDQNWSTTVSVWLRLDPDKDLEPGYCDPVQIVGDDGKKGFIFLEWSKDETPRYFRFAIRPLFHIWNPTDVKWDEIPSAKRPVGQVERAPFSRETWTHVVFSLENINDKSRKPVGRLHMNSQLKGTIENWDLTLGGDPASVLLVLGADSMLVVARYDQKQPIADNWNRCRDQLKAAAPHAEKQRIKLLVENVWATFLISPWDLARFIDEIGSPWVQVHFDIGNTMPWGVAEHGAQVLGPRSQKLDVKEYDLKKAMGEGMAKGFDVPLGEGSINWPAVRAELAKIHFTGWAAAEVKGGDWAWLADVARRMDRVLDL